MRIFPLYLSILLIISCDQNPKRFDIKSSDFKKKSSHHYYPSAAQDELQISKNEIESANHGNILDIESEIIINDTSDKEGIFSGLFNMFSSADKKIDSLDQVINDCEERLYTHADEANSKQTAINSLIDERNHLLKELDSLQTTMVQSKIMSNRRLVDLESDHRKLKALIRILSTEIE